MQVNAFLGELVNARGVLNAHSYNLNLFGTPSPTEPWGWNFYGHHVCLNCLMLGGQMVLTPVFLGAEPNEIDTGPLAGLRSLVDEERLGLALMRALPPELQASARLYERKRDPLMPPGRVAMGDELHLDHTWFCWIGGFEDEVSPFYYRLQGPVLIVEFDHHAGVFLGNPEPERFHIHTLMRTPNGNDYGMDLVRQHCACRQSGPP